LVNFVANGVIKIVRGAYEYILRPLEKAVVWIVKRALIPLFIKIAHACKSVKNIVIKVARAIYHIFEPLRKMVSTASKWVWKSVVMPIVNGIIWVFSPLKNLILRVAQTVYNSTIYLGDLSRMVCW
jgi:hypothetical protein